MKKFFTLVFVITTVAAVNAQQTPTGTGIAEPVVASTITIPSDQLLILKEKDYNFGKIPQGKPVMHVFEVMNKSADSLKIVNVQASCGCTTPEWEKDKVVAPDGGTKITVGYNAAAEGPFNKMITITYNGTQTKQITITGEVWKTPATSAPENNKLNDLKN